MTPLRLLFAAILTALLGLTALAPAQAASVPVGSQLSLDRATRADTEQVQYRSRYGRPVYRPRAVYRRRVVRPAYVYRPRPVYRRCVTRPQTVLTRYGYVRRWVRVCR